MQGKGEAAAEDEVPEWERYNREQELGKKERRFRFKKGRGRREEDDEVGVLQAGCGGAVLR